VSSCKAEKQAGNALFLILIGVALFALLAYAVTQSGRSAGDLSKEQAALLAARITQMGADTRAGVTRMILSGTAAGNIIYSASPTTNNCPGSGGPTGNNAYCTSGATCLFAPDSGGVTPPYFPPGAWVAAYGSTGGPGGTSIVAQIMGPGTGSCDVPTAVSGMGTGASDLILVAEGLTKSVCQAINAGLGISGIPASISPWTWGISATSGVASSCVEVAGYPGLYTWYQVLIEN
jgi:hypothetical protein